MKKISIFILLSILFLAGPASGAEAGDPITPILCKVAKAVYGVALGAIAICWAVVAALFLMSLGKPENLNTAKKSVVVAIAGTAIIILGTLSIDIVKNAVGGTGEDAKNICDVKAE